MLDITFGKIPSSKGMRVRLHTIREEHHWLGRRIDKAVTLLSGYTVLLEWMPFGYFVQVVMSFFS